MAADELVTALSSGIEQDGELGGPPGEPVSGQEEDETIVWRYPEMCAHWGVSRATVERWVRRFERTGDGIPVRRDPSGRPYWLAAEASAEVQPLRAEPARSALTDHERLDGLRRLAARGRRVS
jgi:transposase-like protein